MKIKEFLTIRYGPLKNKAPFQLGDFNLFWGKNEDGKTLTIDALVKLLLGRNTKDFEHIDRVKENPEGYVIIEDDKGKEMKLPERGNLAKVADLNPSECRNIFIIRNSDLAIGREGEFYTNVTDRLTGLIRTKDISEIREALEEIGKITPSGEFRDIKDEKLKTRIDDAKNLVEKKIENLDKEIKESRFDELEEESTRKREKIEGIEQEIKSLEDARKREKYEKGKEALDNLKESLDNLKGLEIYNEEDEQLWRDCEKDIKTYGEDKEKSLTDLQRKEEEFKETSDKLTEVERDFRVFGERKKRIDDEVKPELKNYEMGVGKVRSEETKNRFYIVAAITSAVLLSVPLLGVIMNPSPILYGPLVFFSISLIIFTTLRFSFIQKKAHLAAVFERIRLAISKFELDAENPEGIYSNVHKFDEEYQQKYEESQDIRRNKEILEGKIKELRDKKIEDIEKKIEDAEEKIEGIKTKSRQGSLEEYTKKLKSKQKLERSIGEQKSILRSHLGEKSERLEENISHWNEEIENLEEYKDKARGIKSSETVASELEGEKQEVGKKLEKINEKMTSFQKEMEGVQQKANEILRLEEEYLYCKTSVDLEAVKDKLQGFVAQNENNKDNVIKVTKIFEEIEMEEKEKVSELFGKESPVTEYFSEITDGLYEGVMFNQEMGKIEVRHEDGAILEAEKLSGGAYDQLYLSIRLALGKKLLKGANGFFIMDDPFIKADKERLQRQIDILNRISQSGWQIIYFTAKDEVKDALKQDIENGNVSYMELPSILLHQNLGLGPPSEFTSLPKTESQTNQGELPL